MNTLIKAIKTELELENEVVTFTHEDDKYYFFRLDDEFFSGIAKVEKSEGTEFYVEFKEDGQEQYRGNGAVTIA